MRTTDGFFVFEGCNGSGKTTVMQKVAERLRGRVGADKVVTIVNPTQNSVGMELRRYIAELKKDDGIPLFMSQNTRTVAFATRLAMLFMADRISVQREIGEATAAQKFVLCDRYALSTLVYQCAMIGDLHLQSNLARTIDFMHRAAALHTPELTFILDAPVEVLRARLAQRGERVDDTMMAHVEPAVRAMYLDIANAGLTSDGTYPWSVVGDIHVTQSDSEIGAVVEDCLETIWNREIQF